MSRRSRPKLPQEPLFASITSLSHEGRGVCKVEGKKAFVFNALPGEDVSFVLTMRKGSFDEGDMVQVEKASDLRVEPPCPHFGVCGGCNFQHLSVENQILHKQSVLQNHFEHLAGVEPLQWVEPIVGPSLGYRHKARLGVRYVEKKNEVLVGFREKKGSFLAQMDSCAVLHPSVSQLIPELKTLIFGLKIFNAIAQIEVAVCEDVTALVFRHLLPLNLKDEKVLREFGAKHKVSIYLQPKGPDTVTKLYPQDEQFSLSYSLPDYGLNFKFNPLDFTQVNPDINRKMVKQALDWMDIQPEDKVLDLFCGLGNFTLPMSKTCHHVIGVEGDKGLVERAKANATLNGLDNVQFYATDLSKDFSQQDWASMGFDKILLDPPRCGADFAIPHILKAKPKVILYVSCNPQTLARDTKLIIDEGYVLKKAGVMDMFPHTAHVESMALFEKKK